MKTRWRCLSWILAAVLMITSIPTGYSITAYAAQDSAQTEQAVSPDHGLLKWNEDNLYLGEDEQISEDGQTYTKAPRTFEGASTDVRPSTNTYQNNFDLNSQEFKDKMKEAFQIEGEIQYINDVEFSYQWYREDAQGNREKLEGETGTDLYNYKVVASDGKAAFILEIALDYIEFEIQDAEGAYDMVYCRFSDLPEDTDWDYTAEQVFPHEYTGLTKEDFESGKAALTDYFEGLDTDTEVEIELDSANGSETLSMSDVDSYDSSTSRFNYKWMVNFEDSAVQPEEYRNEDGDAVQGTDTSWIDSIYTGSFYNGKKVANYECQVELCYNGMVVGTLNKKFKVVYNPIIIENEPEVTVYSRNNGKQTFVVNAEIKDEEICSDILYQWYSVKDNKDTVMDGETTDTLKVKITDPSVSYKCVVTGKWREGYAMDWSKAVVFKINTIPGYRLHDRAGEDVYTALNEKAELYVDATVDDGYTLDYKWEKVDRRADSNEYVFETVGTASKLEVTPKDDKDFESYYVEEDEENYRYRLTVTVTDSKKQAVDTKKYYFKLSKSEDTGYESESSSAHQDIFYGEPAEVYVKASVNDKHMVKQTWYYLIDSQAYYKKYNEETGKEETIFLQEGFKEPVCDLTDDQSWTEDWTEDGYPIYRKYYYNKVDASVSGVKLSADGSTLTVDSLKEGTRFKCETGIYRKTNEEDDVATYSRNFELNVKTDLSAYAKNETIECSLGEQAVLEVSAQNFNTKTRPITYTWKKYDQEKNEYVTLDNKTAAYTISSVKEADYGEYRVEVSDEVESRTVRFNLTKERLETVVYTPESSYFNKAIGDEVTLTADIGFSADTKVFYEWYHEERTYGEGNGYWELLNQDKNEYELKLDNEKKYGRYKCLATYKNGNVSYTHTFIYHVNSNYAFTCERLTPSEQHKKMGDSITYQVRVLTDDPNIKEDQIKYQWYYDDESDNVVEIKDAVSASYTINKLAAENFRTIYCRITAVDAENNILKETSTGFETYLYTDIYLETSGEQVEAEPGSDVTLKPVLVNAENQPLTYQWYRSMRYYDEDDDDYYYRDQIIYGATAKDYTISKISDNEFGSYTCEIMLEGIRIASYSAQVVKNTEEAEVTVERAEGMEETILTTLGSPVEMAVTAKSNKNLKLRYQWYIVDGYYDDDDEEYYDSLRAIGGATAASYKIDKVMPKDLDTYRCVVTDEKGNENWVDFEVRKTANLDVSTDSLYTSDTIGFETSYGKDVTLKATATTDPKYNIFYQWYKYDEETDSIKKLIGETSAELAIKNVSEKDLGRYQCEVYNEIDDAFTLNYYVYVNTGLVVEPSVRNAAAVNGAVKMYVDARANQGEAISYQWFKYVEREEGFGFEPIAGADKSAYSIAKLMKEHYGTYRCVVSTKGESYAYSFNLNPSYRAKADRMYAQKGNTVTFKTEIQNPAADAKYTYQWYARDIVTGAYMKTKETGSSCKAVMPAVSSRQIAENGYAYAAYKYRILDGEEIIAEDDVAVKVLPDVTYSSKLPETSHPYDKRYSLQAYQNKGAKQLQITFDTKTDLDGAVIDKNGNDVNTEKGLGGTVTVDGDSFIILAYNDEETSGNYGYKVTAVKRLGDPAPIPDKPQQPAKKVPAKGTKYTYKNVTYKVTKSAAKNGTVTVSGVKSKSLKSAVIQASVKINGYTFKVTAVDKNAFKGCKKLTSVKVGANVTSIGANAFNGCKKLKTITISTKNLKKVGSGAFKGIVKNAKIKVPSAKLKAYQKLLKNKGQGKKVKITK